MDKLLKDTNLATVIGTNSWKEQFIEAVTVSGGTAWSFSHWQGMFIYISRYDITKIMRGVTIQYVLGFYKYCDSPNIAIRYYDCIFCAFTSGFNAGVRALQVRHFIHFLHVASQKIT